MENDFGQEYISGLTRTQKRIKLYLAKLANKKYPPISYSGLCQALNLPYSMDNQYHRNLLSEDLGEISKEEVDIFGWPMLSAMVVEKNQTLPAKGFFTWAEYLYDIELSNENKRMDFFIKEFNSLRAKWCTHEGAEEIKRLEEELNNSNNVV